MKSFSYWLIHVSANLSSAERRRWADRAGISYSSLQDLIKRPERDCLLTTAHRLASSWDTYLADVIEWLEHGELDPATLAAPRPLPVLHTDVLIDTQSPDALRYMFAAWTNSAANSFGITQRALGLQSDLSAAFMRKLLGPSCSSIRIQSAHQICNGLQIRLSAVIRQLEHIIDLVADANGELGPANEYLVSHAKEVWPLIRPNPVPNKAESRPRRQRRQR
jgi:hypothetical protein